MRSLCVHLPVSVIEILFACLISAQLVDLSIADTPAAADWIRCGRWESSPERNGWPDYPVVVTVCAWM